MIARSAQIELPTSRERPAHGPWSDLALHTIGWRAFQDLCSQVCEVVLSRIIDDARTQVRRSVKTLEERKREHEEGSEDEADWTHIVTQKEEAPTRSPVAMKRSVFNDVDK